MFLSFPSHPGTAEGHCVTVPAVLSCLGGRDGVSTAPRASCQPHELYVSPTGSTAAYQPRVAACHVTASGFLPSTLPRRILSHFSPAVTWCRQVV